MTVEEIAKGLSKAQRTAIVDAEPYGDHWWMPYEKGEDILEQKHIFRFGTAQFTDLGLAVRDYLKGQP